MNYYYIQNFKFSTINSIQIKIASPNSILMWGSRKLPNEEIVGEIKTAQTMNYKTLKPENTGLFCEKIFGPIKDFECACGKRYENEFVGFCAHCGIEFISSHVRRHRLGYIRLVSPVIHIWYIKYISLLLDIPLKYVESIVYCTDSIVFNKFNDSVRTIFLEKNKILKNKLFQNFRNIIITNVINNDYYKKLHNIKYSLYIQKDLLKYLYNLKNSFFFFKSSYINGLHKDFHFSYYTITNCYAVSYFYQWEAKKQWNNIAFYMNCTSLIKENSNLPIQLYLKNITSSLKEYEERFLFGVKVIYNWLKYFDYNFQLINLERQIRFYIFELKEEIKELSILISTCFFENKNFQSNYLFNFRKKIEKLHSKKNRIFRRLKLIIYFRQAQLQPRWMILCLLPVLPPDLRPIVELGSNKIAVSDLNKLYQTILLRNIRLKKFYETSHITNFTDEIRYTKRLLQEAVDELIQTDKTKLNNSQASKSLSDILKGKKGRFRQNLLGKRVDYSGRSVIIVDPELKLHECGLPKKMVLELFQPFIIQYLIFNKFAKTISGAKQLIYTNNPVILRVIKLLLKNYLVLLNRAPTLHKLGIQAFQPKLIKGKAIRLHPLVCPAFNADFDGDQMGVHIPLSFEARSEAWKLLWSRNNLLFSSIGTPIITPGQDVVLGCYYLTSLLMNIVKDSCITDRLLSKPNFKKSIYFTNLYDVIKAYNQEKLDIHTNIWIKWKGLLKMDETMTCPTEIEIYSNGNFCFNYPEHKFIYNYKGYKVAQLIKTTVGRVLFNTIIQNIIN